MFVVAAVFALLGIFLGAITYLPLGISAIAAVAIAGWLTHFAIRERGSHRNTA
ncbi:hypothetical protein [Streptomyces boluensis]|uniref:hypothetical protein n=1 Tax=Streptomyces boluensis TaxID=1775135 RepID=UPI001651BA05|nr:hypothetical protein [Streptomyces boluensis]